MLDDTCREKAMASPLIYFAEGRQSESDGVTRLGSAPGPEAACEKARSLLRTMRLGQRALVDEHQGQGIGVQPVAIVYWKESENESVLMARRRQVDGTRGGEMVEGIVFGSPLPRRPLESLGILAETASLNEAKKRERDVSGGWHPKPALDAFSDQCQKRLSVALAKFANADHGHVAVILPREETHLAVPLACWMDHILPPEDKARGFAVANSPAAEIGAGLIQELDWTVTVAERSHLPSKMEGSPTICDFSSKEEQPTDAAVVLGRICRDGHAARTLAKWLEQSQISRLSDLTWFWKRLRLREDVAEKPSKGVEILRAAITTDAVGWLSDRTTFKWLIVVLRRNGPDPSALDWFAGLVMDHVREFPPLLAWLVDACKDDPCVELVEKKIKEKWQQQRGS